jgi:SAM-dependent methyltransferase
MTTWKSIREKEGAVAPAQITLSDLIAINSFDTGDRVFPTDSWLAYSALIRTRMRLASDQTVRDIGCGSGAFLHPLVGKETAVCRIVFSVPYIEVCSTAMTSGTVKHAEATDVPFEDDCFDGVVSNSVFRYFPDFGYAEQVIGEISRGIRSDGCVAILDGCDAALEANCEATRRAGICDEGYDRFCGELNHLFYPKEWFERIAADCGRKPEIIDQAFDGYENAAHKYNVLLDSGG